MKRVSRAGCLGWLCALGLAVPAAAQAAAQSEDWASDLTHDLMSPFGSVRHSIADCPSAVGLVRWVMEQEQLGRAREEVEADLYARFGEVLRAAPRAEGFGLAAYVVPVGVAFAGAALLVLLLRRHVHTRAPPPEAVRAPTPTAADTELARIVDEELRG